MKMKSISKDMKEFPSKNQTILLIGQMHKLQKQQKNQGNHIQNLTSLKESQKQKTGAIIPHKNIKIQRLNIKFDIKEKIRSML